MSSFNPLMGRYPQFPVDPAQYNGGGQVAPPTFGNGTADLGVPNAPEASGSPYPMSQPNVAPPSFTPPSAPDALSPSLNVPSPTHDMGFWETIRTAARNDPSTFYQVLAQFSQLNSGGIDQVMARRDAKLQNQAALELKREEIKSNERIAGHKATRRADERDADYIRRVRARAEKAGVLTKFEYEYGMISDAQDAEALEGYISSHNAMDEDNKTKLDFLKGLTKSPTTNPMGRAGELAKTDPIFAANIKAIKEDGGKQAKLDLDKRNAELKLMNARIEQVQKVLTTTKLDPGNREYITTKRQENQALFTRWSNLDRQVSEMSVIAPYLDPEAKTNYQNMVQERDATKQQYELAKQDLTAFIDTMSPNMLSPNPEPNPGAPSGGTSNTSNSEPGTSSIDEEEIPTDELTEEDDAVWDSLKKKLMSDKKAAEKAKSKSK